MKKSKLRNFVKQSIITILFRIVDKLVFGTAAIEEKTLLLIRLDAIGDYILFRNYIDLISKSPKFSKHKITLLGNKAWQDLELGRQESNIDEYIWIDRKKFFRNPIYRWRMLKKVCAKGYELIVQPTYSREYFVGDNIVKLATGRSKIGNAGDLGNQTALEKRRSDKYYTKLIYGSNKVMYEFERNRIFFESILEMKIKNQRLPKLPVYLSLKKEIFKKKYIVFFIGSNTPQRKWAVEKYARLATLLKQRSKFENHDFILCGSVDENKDAEQLISACPVDIKNYVGKTTLVELTNIISGADLLVTNETCAHHIGVGTKCNAVVVIYSGNHYGRFVPYIEHNERYKVALHPKISISPRKYRQDSNAPGYNSQLNINDISVVDVLNVINSL